MSGVIVTSAQTRRTRSHANEQGLVLPMVLVMITVVAVVLVALLSLGTTTFAASRVATSTTQRTYAAHAGIDAAIQQLRAGGTLCVDGSKLAVQVNNRPAVVTCAPAANSFDVGAGGWAVFINPAAIPSPGLETGNAVNVDEKVITGPVFNGGRWTDVKAKLTVTNGQVLSSAAGCGDLPFNSDVVTTPIANFRACVGGASPAPAANPPLPSVSNALLPANLPAPAPSSLTGSGANACRIFRPGYYAGGSAAAAELALVSPYTYFESGVYLFDNVGAVQIAKSRKAVAGQPLPGYTATIDVSAKCPTADTGKGALFLLGGNSSIEVTDGGQMEIHPFLPSATSTDSPVSIRTIEPSDIGVRSWITAATVSTLTTNLDAVSTNKNKTQFIVRGAIYTPRARVSLDPRGNNAQVVLSGGVVVGRLVLTAPAAIGSDKLQIGTGGASGVRRVQIRSEAVERSWCGCAADTNPTGAVRTIVGYATLAVSGTGLIFESWRIGS